MSLLDDLERPKPKARTFAEWLIGQTPEIRAALEKAARNPEWSDYGLEHLLRKHGAPVSHTAVRAWRADVTD